METPTGEPRWPSLRPRKGETNSSPYRQVFLGFRALVVILFLILIAQLVRLQVVESGKYQERAEINALRELVEPSARGLIYDREGRPLVQNVARYFAAVIPADLPERGEIGVYRQLGQVIGMKAEEIDQKVKEQSQKQGPLTPVLVKEDLSRETAMVLREVEPHLPGVRLLIQPTRAYLQGSMLSHVLGYVGSISEEEYAQLRIQGYQLQDRVGKAGVEMVYEKLLRGRPGKKLVEVDSEGREKRVISEKRPQDGANILLTIDLDLQQYLYNVLKQYADRSDNAAAAIMDVHSGEVLAMVSLPEYDNNIFSRKVTDQELAQLTNDPGKPLLNHAIGEMYPPGSTFKTIVGAAALQEKVATPATSITSRGVIYVENEFDPNIIYRFPDWAALGTLDFYGGLAMSSNVYFYYLAGGYQREGFVGLGEERLARYARSFGLGQPTGIDLPGESAGTVPDARWKEKEVGDYWFLGDTYNFGIGQGYLRVTPMQMLVAASAFANGGQLLQPHLLKEMRDSQGNVLQTVKPKIQGEVPVDKQYLKVVTEGMVQSVTRGVAKTAAVPRLQVAGKTGTAEFGQERGDGTFATHGWFIGFAPAENPQVAIVVFVQRGGGGAEAAPVAGKVLDYIFNGSNLAARLKEDGS